MNSRRLMIATLAILCLAALPAAADEWNKTYKISGVAELRLDARDGNVRVTGADSPQIEARITAIDWRISENEVRVVERQNGDRVEIEVKAPRLHGNGTGRWAIEIELHVPRNANLDIHSGDGNITAHGLATRAARKEDGALSTIAPAVARQLAGPVRLATGDGNITLEGACGKISLRTGDGNITAAELDGAVDAQTGDGNVVVDGRFDELRLRSGDGNLEARVRPGSTMQASWDVHTGDGRVTLRLPEGFSADLDAHTGDGHISLAFPVTVSGRIDRSSVRGKMNAGGGLLTVRSGDGAIRIERL